MPETPDSQENLAYIRTEIEEIKGFQRFQIAMSRGVREAVTELFEKSRGAAELYLALEAGPRTQEELAAMLGKDRSNVSRSLAPLLAVNLVRKLGGPGGSRRGAYAWSPIERLVRASRLARQVIKRAESKAAGRPDDESPTVWDDGPVRPQGTDLDEEPPVNEAAD